MTTVTVDSTGKVGLPEDILQASHIQPGTELIVIAEAGKITLMDRKQVLRERMKVVDHRMRARLREYAGMSLDARSSRMAVGRGARDRYTDVMNPSESIDADRATTHLEIEQ